MSKTIEITIKNDDGLLFYAQGLIDWDAMTIEDVSQYEYLHDPITHEAHELGEDEIDDLICRVRDALDNEQLDMLSERYG